jgi:vacuolar-type H+-ATPase subunit H
MSSIWERNPEEFVADNLLKMIQELENAAEKIIRDANEQAKAIGEEGQSKAHRIEQEKARAAQTEAEKIRASSTTDTEKEAERLRECQRKTLTETIAKARIRVETAAKHILSRLESAQTWPSKE